MQTANAVPSIPKVTATNRAARVSQEDLDPNKRYLSLTVVRGNAFVDFLNVRTDESLSIAVSFLKNRFSTRQVLCSAEPVFDESFLFEFSGENNNMKFDAATMLKLSQPIHLTILKHRKNEKAQVIGTKLVDWRSLLFCNQVEINSEILPISMQQKGSLGVLTLHLDLAPALSQTELLNEESVNKQISLETRFEQESI